MSDIVTDPTGKTVISDNGTNNNGYGFGLEAKDVSYLNANFSAQTDRHVLDAIWSTAKSSELAVEKTAAATAVAIEKIGAASALQAAINTAAVQAAIATNNAELKATMLEVEARAVRDDLAQVRAAFTAYKAAKP
jgi:regulator of protease activity HflC (stomatin/prohibitin superfamily)